MPLKIALAGRPNVGKSTLFNRLVGKSMALVDNTPGVTRDWREGEGHLFDLRFTLFDTAGLEDDRPLGSVAERTAGQTKVAIEHADVLVFMVDARKGVTVQDEVIALEVRKMNLPVLLLANKCDSDTLPDGFNELLSLGFGDPIAISATHGDGLSELHAGLVKMLPKELIQEARKADEEEDEEKRLHLAVVGRPNAGKSTLVNKIIGEDRVLTGPEPGLTRDSIPINWTYRGKTVRLVDTAGMRRRARVEEKLERMSVLETLRAIRLAHVVVLVLDATKPFDKQDYTIAQHVISEGRALVVALNKWDLVKDKDKALKDIQDKVDMSMAQLPGVPLVPISATKGMGLPALMKQVMASYDLWNRRVPTGQLNRWLEDMETSHPPPLSEGRRVKLRYITQIKARPPTFAMWVNKPVSLPDNYVRFLSNGLRRSFDMFGVPIRFILKKGENPYDTPSKKKYPDRRKEKHSKK